MSWQERDYADDPRDNIGRPGGDWQGVRPRFDNPMTWHVPLGRVLDIDVRIHVVFLIYIVVQLGRSMRTDAAMSLGLAAAHMGCLFGIVLLHEFGHCLACRRTGGQADEILMWPLGGLAFCRPAPPWRAHLATAVGGPLVNVAICCVLGPILAVICRDGLAAAFPNPLVFRVDGLRLDDGRQPWWLLTMYFVHDLSLVLLLFNLLPIFPLDGGRILQALLWPKVGYSRSMRLAVHAGYVGAVGLFIVGAVSGGWALVAIACFGGLTCYFTIKQLEFTDEFMGHADSFEPAAWAAEPHEDEEPRKPPRRARKEERAREAAAAEAAEVDRILQKIGREGMEALSGGERKLLRRATERRQREG